MANLCINDPGYEDVIKGNQYRDGSATVRINYEMAAKHYTEAMKKGYAEALYGLAMLTMKGLGM